MHRRAISSTLAILLVAGCQNRAQEAATADEAKAVAKDYLAEQLPQVSVDKLEVSTVDLGDKWRVSHSVPEGGTGGPIILIITKRDAEVVHMEMHQ
jgi:hypothetical protein